jgi:hypothetical protein
MPSRLEKVFFISHLTGEENRGKQYILFRVKWHACFFYGWTKQVVLDWDGGEGG